MITGEDLHVTRILLGTSLCIGFLQFHHLLLLWFDMIRRGSKVNYIAERIDYFKPDYVINYVIIPKLEALNTPQIGFITYLMIILQIIMAMVIHGHGIDKDNCCPSQP